MSKTPEQMAEEYSQIIKVSQDVDLDDLSWALISKWESESFLAGYKAAINSPEKPDTCEHILDMEKMVDVNPSSGWISVKDRLPESSVGWTTVYGCILSRWAVQPGFYTKDSGIWVSRFVDQDEDYHNYLCFESVTHWMPLPKQPKEEI